MTDYNRRGFLGALLKGGAVAGVVATTGGTLTHLLAPDQVDAPALARVYVPTLYLGEGSVLRGCVAHGVRLKTGPRSRIESCQFTYEPVADPVDTLVHVDGHHIDIINNTFMTKANTGFYLPYGLNPV